MRLCARTAQASSGRTGRTSLVRNRRLCRGGGAWAGLVSTMNLEEVAVGVDKLGFLNVDGLDSGIGAPGNAIP